MKLRQAKKIGRCKPGRHRLLTTRRAAARFLKDDVRRYGLPGSMDCLLRAVFGYPNFGGFEDEDRQKQKKVRHYSSEISGREITYDMAVAFSKPFETWPDDIDWEIVRSEQMNLTGRYRSLREYRDELRAKIDAE